jgi:hypothetical protein
VIAGEVCPIEAGELARIIDGCSRIATEHGLPFAAMPWGDFRDDAPLPPDQYLVVIGIEVAHVERDAGQVSAADWDGAAKFSGEHLGNALEIARARVPKLIEALAAALEQRLEGDSDSECRLIASGPGCVAWVDTPASGQIGTVPDESPEIIGVEPGAYRLAIEIE